jgi:ribosomal protein S27E
VTKASAKNGLNRCPHCGGSDIATDTKEGKLRCKYCKTLFDAKSDNEAGGVDKLKGDTVNEGAADIIPGEDIILTFKCPACGAEVVINTEEATSASCHWCRHIFSVN